MTHERSRGAATRGALGPAAALLLLGCVACGPGPLPSSMSHPLAGGAAPEFETESTAEAYVAVPGAGRTRVTVLDFWASWCAACDQTIPALDVLFRDHKGDGVMVVGISIDATEGAAEARARELGASFPIVNDPYQRIAGSYGVAQIPLTFVIDGAGRIRWVGRDPGSARRAVDVVLSEGASRPRDVFE